IAAPPPPLPPQHHLHLCYYIIPLFSPNPKPSLNLHLLLPTMDSHQTTQTTPSPSIPSLQLSLPLHHFPMIGHFPPPSLPSSETSFPPILLPPPISSAPSPT
ncbi:hypothetical protein CCACVL1_25294, partial [Corchorus capsularis]